MYSEGEHIKLEGAYTILSKDTNSFTTYQKKIALFYKAKARSFEGRAYLPTQRYVTPLQSREKPCLGHIDRIGYSGTLTEEQSYILDIVSKRWQEYSYGCGLIVMKTGKGKSHIIMNIAKMFNARTLVLCHNKKTVKEMVDKFQQYTGYTPGVYYSDKKAVKDITITTHDSFVSMPEDLKGFDVILHDECDTGLSKNMINALCLSEAKLHYGFTGTPYRQDMNNADLQLIFGKQIQYSQEDTPTGYNFIPKIHIVKYRDKTQYEYENFAEMKNCLMANQDRLQKQMEIIDELVHKRKCILILTERVEEAETYYNILNEKWYGVGLITGKTNIKDDEKWLADNMGKGCTIIIGTTVKMARGVDIPHIDTVCLFSALHFQGTVVQAVGRSLRTHPGKSDVVLVDWSDYSVLPRQYYERSKAYCKEYNLSKEQFTTYDFKVGPPRYDF